MQDSIHARLKRGGLRLQWSDKTGQYPENWGNSVSGRRTEPIRAKIGSNRETMVSHLILRKRRYDTEDVVHVNDWTTS